jgi:hypothetical protein
MVSFVDSVATYPVMSHLKDNIDHCLPYKGMNCRGQWPKMPG